MFKLPIITILIIANQPIGIWESMKTAENKPIAKSSEYLVSAAKSDLEKAKKDWFPSLSLGLTMTRTDSLEGYEPGPLDVNFFGVGENFGNASMTLTYPLYSFGMKKSQINLQEMNYFLAKLDKETTLQQSRLAIANSWLNLWLANKNLLLAEDKLNNSSKVLEDAQARYSVQLISELELIQFESEFLSSKENMSQASSLYESALTLFISMTGIQADIELAELPQLDKNLLVEFITDEKNERINVKRARLNLEISRKTKELLFNRPNLILRTTANHPENEQGFESGDTLRSDIALNWEFMKPSKTAELKSSDEKIKAAEFVYAQSVIDENALIESSIETIGMYQSRIENAEYTLELMRRISMSITEGLAVGTSSYLEWSNAENNYLAAAVNLATIKTNFLKEIFNLGAGNIDSLLKLNQNN
ncbi:hypothetical protein CL659_03460 [bacterium]|nr:hypothetical protein [bacterium]|tara:strand:+ start:42424 stop:43686 length:1263 start_codon:yes stop_codon:yes gene_type:complete